VYAILNTDSSHASYFFFQDPAPAQIYTLSLHDALPIFEAAIRQQIRRGSVQVSVQIDREPKPDDYRLNQVDDVAYFGQRQAGERSEEHTSELQSPCNLVCRLLLEKKKHNKHTYT